MTRMVPNPFLPTSRRGEPGGGEGDGVHFVLEIRVNGCVNHALGIRKPDREEQTKQGCGNSLLWGQYRMVQNLVVINTAQLQIEENQESIN